MRIWTVPTLNLRPEMNAVALFYIYSKIFSFLTGLLHALNLCRVGLASVSQDVSQVCHKTCRKCVTRHVASVSEA